ncbi:unnamed protein product [Dimorphilus gyrociliatus]|uniref:Uncharacterized protein n=1 Tax=Dimorphilus gyrociliatus TaxID=2664684 RepID=A0A7I8W2E6_9ANNE|nr:unnamed protein product [Dimorphilus gyrociliatus]
MKEYFNRMSAFFTPYQEYNSELSFHPNEYSYQQNYPQTYERPYQEHEQPSYYETNKLRMENIQQFQNPVQPPVFSNFKISSNLASPSSSDVKNSLSVKYESNEQIKTERQTEPTKNRTQSPHEDTQSDDQGDKKAIFPWMKSQFG